MMKFIGAIVVGLMIAFSVVGAIMTLGYFFGQLPPDPVHMLSMALVIVGVSIGVASYLVFRP